jgi:hypothetical protein
MSKLLDETQRKWHTGEKEAYAMVWALRDLKHELGSCHFELRTDHKNLLFINTYPSPKVCRWKIEMGEFDFSLRYIKGKENVVADSLSRLFIDEDTFKAEKKLIEDKLELRNKKVAALFHMYECNIGMKLSKMCAALASNVRRSTRLHSHGGLATSAGEVTKMGTTAQATHKRGSSQATTVSVSKDDDLPGVQDVKDVYCMETSSTASQTPEMLKGMPKVGLGVDQTYEAETGLKTSGGVGAEGGVGCDKSRNQKHSGKPNPSRPV